MSGRLITFRESVLTEIKRILPNIKSCEAQFGRFDLSELEREMIRAPGVRLAILRSPLAWQPNGQAEAALNMVAFVITEGSKREEDGWNIAEAIGTLLHPAQLWGMTKLTAPSSVVIQPIISAAVKQRGVGVMSVEWNQTLRQLGDGLFGPDGVVISEFEVNGEQLDMPEAGHV